MLADHDRLAFVRAHLADRVVVLFNRAPNESQVDLPVSPEFADGDNVAALSGKRMAVRDGQIGLEPPAEAEAFMPEGAD